MLVAVSKGMWAVDPKTAATKLKKLKKILQLLTRG